MTTLKQVREAVLAADSYSVKDGVFTIREGFFYRHGRTSENLVAAVLRAFPTAIIRDSGEVWKPFRGGAKIAQSSHWFVKFTVPDKAYFDARDEAAAVDFEWCEAAQKDGGAR